MKFYDTKLFLYHNHFKPLSLLTLSCVFGFIRSSVYWGKKYNIFFRKVININIENPYGFIYITTNKINGKRYIGRKVFDTGSRWKSYLGSGDYLRNSIKKYGAENFYKEIIDIAYTNEELNKKENDWINIYNAVESDDFYNLIEGGNIVDVLNRRNSVIVICIDTNKVFKSLKEVYDYYGFTPAYIKSTFNKYHNPKKYYEENLIFRKLDYYNENTCVCCLCGTIIDLSRVKICLCEECNKRNKYKKDIKYKNISRCSVCNKIIVKKSNNQKYCKKHMR